MCPCDSIPSHFHFVYFPQLFRSLAELSTRFAHFQPTSPWPPLFPLVVAAEKSLFHCRFCLSILSRSYFIIPSLRAVVAGMLVCTVSFFSTSQLTHFRQTYRQLTDSHDTLAAPVEANPCARPRSCRCNDAEVPMGCVRSIRSSNRRGHHQPVATIQHRFRSITFRFIKSWKRRRK